MINLFISNKISKLLFVVFFSCSVVKARPNLQQQHAGRQVKPEPINEYPIIGVVAQEVNELTEDSIGVPAHSYIAASYVKFIEGGGARVVPVWINKPKKYYEKIMKRING